MAISHILHNEAKLFSTRQLWSRAGRRLIIFEVLIGVSVVGPSQLLIYAQNIFSHLMARISNGKFESM